METSFPNAQPDPGTDPDGLGAEAGPRLGATAQMTVGDVRETAGFLTRAEGSLFMVLDRPAAQPPVGLLTVCSALFGEQHADYRREVRMARALASAGFAVTRFHYRGVGNSAPAEASLDAFVRDALDVVRVAQRETGAQRRAILGVGPGALVAARAAGASSDGALLLWKPVGDGSQFFRGLFRARMIAATRPGGERPSSTDSLLARMAAEGSVDVMGFTLWASLYESLGAARLDAALVPHIERVLIQPFRGSRATEAKHTAATWRERGCRVDLEPVKLPEDPWFVPDRADVSAAVMAAEQQLIATSRDWLLDYWGEGHER